MNSKELSQQLNISENFAKVLLQKGLDTSQKVKSFLSCDLALLKNPFEISNMQKLVDRLNLAIQNQESIMIFGDYDADGICSSAMLYEYFFLKGLQVNFHIPQREEGYGINDEAVESIAEEFSPDIILTCDCGISAVNEVEYIKDLGIEPIITDHHELPDVLPDCLIVNPKLDGDCDLANLCGAGVVFKIIQAMEGIEYAKKFLDIATIATVADSVPLVGENRILVANGLNILNENNRRGICELAKISGINKIDSRSLAFGIVPRINAAGRIGIAAKAIEIFLSDENCTSIAKELDTANSIRQKLCDETYNQAIASKCFVEQKNNKILILYQPNWQSGIVGIVASRLVEKFERPVIIFSKNGDVLKGSGRSTKNVNMFKMLSAMTDLFVQFGGHSQACGVTILEQNMGQFIERANQYLQDIVIFDKNEEDTIAIKTSDINLQFAEEIQLLEPFGVGNKTPIFSTQIDNLQMQTMTNHPNHLVGKYDGISFLAFNFKSTILQSNCKKNITFEISKNEYKGKSSVRVVLKSVETSVLELDKLQLKVCQNYLFRDKFVQKEYEKIADLTQILSHNFGVALITFSQDTARELSQKYNLPICYFEDIGDNNSNRILFAPSGDLSNFDIAVYFETPIDTFGTKKEYVFEKADYLPMSLNTDRQAMIEGYKILRQLISQTCTYEQLTSYIFANQDKMQLYFCYLVFLELGIFFNSKGKIFLDSTKKCELSSSKLYRIYE